jgi:hypothetical protein
MRLRRTRTDQVDDTLSGSVGGTLSGRRRRRYSALTPSETTLTRQTHHIGRRLERRRHTHGRVRRRRQMEGRMWVVVCGLRRHAVCWDALKGGIRQRLGSKLLIEQNRQRLIGRTLLWMCSGQRAHTWHPHNRSEDEQANNPVFYVIPIQSYENPHLEKSLREEWRETERGGLLTGKETRGL